MSNEAFYNYHAWSESLLNQWEADQDDKSESPESNDDDDDDDSWLNDPSNVMSRYHY